MTGTNPAVAEAVTLLDAIHRPDPWVDQCMTCGPEGGRWPCATREVADDLRGVLDGEGAVAGPYLSYEVNALRRVVRLLVDRFHDDTPMGPNVIDLPDVRWRILPPSVAQAVKRALDTGSPTAGGPS